MGLMLKKVIKDVDIEINVNGKERKKKVIVKVFGGLNKNF